MRAWPLFSAILTLWLTATASAQDVEVDLELVLLVDVSRSMSEGELELQRRGYAEALSSQEVFKAVQSGLLQTIALTYVEWAGTQEVIVDWRLIKTRQDLLDFADRLTLRFDPALRRTSISNALRYGAERIAANNFLGLRRVLDISGDGPNNLGPYVEEARDAVLAQGITINGLPLMTEEGSFSGFHLDNLDIYYRACVTGGTGSFVIPVYDWPDFSDAVRRKLVLEIAGLLDGPQVHKAQSARDPSDCWVGEKIWEDFQRNRFIIP